jgi:hypothetical protein
VYCVLCNELKLCKVDFIFVPLCSIVAFTGTTLPFYFSLQRINQLVKESLMEVPVG